jgi:hypothetical protein
MSAFTHQSRNLLALALVTLACSKTSHDAPLGEIVLSIDTDAPVPDFVGRLRVDIFDEDSVQRHRTYQCGRLASETTLGSSFSWSPGRTP